MILFDGGNEKATLTGGLSRRRKSNKLSVISSPVDFAYLLSHGFSAASLDLSRFGEEGFLFEDHPPLIFGGLRKDGWREVGVRAMWLDGWMGD